MLTLLGTFTFGLSLGASTFAQPYFFLLAGIEITIVNELKKIVFF
jgi:hypothetical protein